MYVLSVTEKGDSCSPLRRHAISSDPGPLAPCSQNQKVIRKVTGVHTAARRARWRQRPAPARLLPGPRFSSL